MYPAIILSIVILGIASIEFWFKSHLDYIDHFVQITLIHILLSSVIISIFFFLFRQLPLHISVSFILFTLIVLLCNILAYFFGRKYLSLNKKELHLSKGSMQFIYLDYRYFIAIVGDILFQQTIIVTILLGLVTLGFTKPTVIISIFILAIVWHILYFSYRYHQKKARLFNAIIMTISVGLGVIVMSFILFNVTNGVIYNFLLHLSFYTIYGVVLRWRFSSYID